MQTSEPESRVVLITKEDNVRRAVRSTLEKAGFTILAASNADSALRLCREVDAPIRLAIVDVGSGQIDEPEFLELLRQSAPGIRVLFMSNSSAPGALEDMGQPWKGGRVLPKPFRRAQLLGKVLEVMSEPLAFTA